MTHLIKGTSKRYCRLQSWGPAYENVRGMVLVDAVRWVCLTTFAFNTFDSNNLTRNYEELYHPNP